MTEIKNKNFQIRTISFILTFFLAVMTLGLFILAELNLGLGSSQNLRNSINDSNYTQGAYAEALAKSKAYIKERNLPEKILAGAVTEARFYMDSSKSIKAALGGKSSLIDTTELETILRQNIDEYFDDSHIIKSETIKTAREEIVQTVSGYYRSCAQFRFGEYFYQLNKKTDKVSPIAIPLLIILIALTFLVLIKMQKFKHRGYRYLSYSLFSATLANMIIWLKLFFFDKVNEDAVANYYLAFSRDYLKSGMHAAAAVTATGAVLFLATFLYANRHKLAGKVS